MSRRPTIYEVARDAGVSIASVSRVVHGQDGVSERTRSHVHEVIEQTGYVPNGAARGHARRRLGMLAFVFRDVEDPEADGRLGGAADGARDAGELRMRRPPAGEGGRMRAPDARADWEQRIGQRSDGSTAVHVDLDAPAGLVAEPGCAQVTLRWLPVDGAGGYVVYRADAPDGDFAAVDRPAEPRLPTRPGR